MGPDDEDEDILAKMGTEDGDSQHEDEDIQDEDDGTQENGTEDGDSQHVHSILH